MSVSSQHYANLSDLTYGRPGVDYHLDRDGNVNVDGVSYKPLEYRSNPTTGYQGTIFQRVDTGEIVVAHRGTEGDKLLQAAGWKDVGADAAMMAARVNPQVDDAMELTRDALELAKRYGAQKGVSPPEVTVTGHSLGGCLAQITAHKFHLRGETFDAYGAASLGYGISEGGHTVVNHLMAMDIVSAGSPHFGQVRVYATPGEIAVLSSPLARYNNDTSAWDERNPVALALLAKAAGMHSMHHFTRKDADDKPDRSVLEDPQAQQLAAQYAPMIQKFRGDIGMVAASARLAGDGVRAVGEQQLRQAEQQQEMARQLRSSVGEAAHTIGQHQRHQAQAQFEANQQLRQGIAQAADAVGQTFHNAVEAGREALNRAVATPSLYAQAKIGALPAQGDDQPIPSASPRAVHNTEPPRTMPPPRASEPTVPPQAQIPVVPEHLRDFRHPGHPLHSRYHEVLDGVYALEERQKIAHGPHSEQAAAVLAEHIDLQRLTPRADWPFERFQTVAQVTLRDKEMIALEQQGDFVGQTNGREIRVPAEQLLTRSVEQVASDWSRQQLPHLHQPQVQATEGLAPALDPRSLPAYDLRHPDHPRYGMFAYTRDLLATEYARWGMQRDPAQLDREAAQGVVEARRQRIEEVGRITLSFPSTPDRPMVSLVEHPGGEFANRVRLDADKLAQAPQLDQASTQLQQVEDQVALMLLERQMQHERDQSQSLGRTI